MAEAISDYEWAAGRLDNPEGGASRDDSPELGPIRPPLGSFLTGRGFITEEQLAEGLKEGAATGRRLGEVAVLRGWVTEDTVAKLLAEQWQLGYVERASIYFDVEALDRLSRQQAQALEALPTRVQDGRVVVAVAEPTEERLAALRAVIGDDTVVVVIPKTALDAGLRSELLSGSTSRDDDGRSPADERRVDEQESIEQYAPGAGQVVPAPPPPARVAAPSETPSPRPAPAVELELDEGSLRDTLGALEAVAGEATALQLRVGELARRLAEIVNDVSSAAGRLEHSDPPPAAASPGSTRARRGKARRRR